MAVRILQVSQVAGVCEREEEREKSQGKEEKGSKGLVEVMTEKKQLEKKSQN